MAKQTQQQQPGEGASDQQQAAAVQLGKMMGPVNDEFDDRVQALHDKRHQAEHEANDYESIYGGERPQEAGYAKMRAAQEGGQVLGPSDIDKEQAKQQQAQSQTQAAQQAATASQAQAQQSPVNAPPAPGGPAGVSVPFPAQKGPQPPPSAQDVEPQVPGVQSPASQIQPPAPDQEEQQE
jgi:hypothetical protein